MTLQEVPTSGTLSDREYYAHLDAKKEYRFVIRFSMTPEEVSQFCEEMIDRGAVRIRAEASDSILFIEQAAKV